MGLERFREICQWDFIGIFTFHINSYNRPGSLVAWLLRGVRTTNTKMRVSRTPKTDAVASTNHVPRRRRRHALRPLRCSHQPSAKPKSPTPYWNTKIVLFYPRKHQLLQDVILGGLPREWVTHVGMHFRRHMCIMCRKYGRRSRLRVRTVSLASLAA